MLRYGIWLEVGQMLHVTLRCLRWQGKDVTCYVKLFVLTRVKDCYMLRHGIWLELGQMRSSGNGGGSRRNTFFRLLVDSCTKKPLDENAPKNHTKISKACIYQNKMAQNPGFRPLEKGIWSNSLQIWSCNSHGAANTKYTFNCKVRSE